MGLFRNSYVLRVVSIVFLTMMGVYACSVSISSGWQRGFVQNRDYQELLAQRYGWFAVISLISFTTAIVVLVRTIKRLNRETHREPDDGESNDE